MKKTLLFSFALSAVFALSSCKSQESAYRQAYNKAREQDASQTDNGRATVAVGQQDNGVTVTPVTPTTGRPAGADDNSDVRTIPGEVTVVSGGALRTYSVVVGSFINQTNAEGLREMLVRSGYDARVLKTNETINGQTGWFRVIASSFEDKASAVQSRNELRNKYAGAWLLYRK
ncbi:SPOR domain-containing protein [Alloprevotella tannerae]|uniref:SPOR domain-containing protein n=1 Tax=Alloprevotella tannerae TaxID=76122 RepID=UPI0026268B92|nr:SPOR domain-containing protein [Alloprevotella tannerae]